MALGTGVHNLSLVVRANNRASRALSSVGRDLTAMDKARKLVQTGFKTLSRVGILAMKALVVAVAIAVAGSILAFSKFDDALTGSLAIVEDVSPEIRKSLQDTAREVAKTTIFSATEAANAYFHLFSAGQTVAQGMKSLPVVAQFAQAGLFDLERATELLVTAQSALGLSFDDPVENMKQMTRVADVLAAADERAVGSIEDFAEALTNRAAAAMRTYNIEIEEGVAVLAAWATQGLKGRTAGQAFSTVVRDLQRAALKEAAAFREVNIAVFDSEENFRNMADIVADLEDAMEGLTDAGKKQLLQDLGFQERSQQRILQLLGTSDAIRQFEIDFKNAGGTVEEVSNKQLESAIKQLGLLKSAIVDVFIGGGSAFDEGFQKVIAGITDFVNKHGPNLIEMAEKAAEAAGEFFGPLLEIIRHLRLFAINTGWSVDAVEDLTDQMQKLNDFFEDVIRKYQELSQPIRDFIGDWIKFIPLVALAAGALSVIAFVLGAIFSPATLVAAAIGALVAGFINLWNNSEEFRQIIGKVGDFFTNTVVPLLEKGWEIIQKAADEFVTWFLLVAVPFLEEAWEVIQIAAAAFVSWFQDDAVPFIMEAWDQVKDTFQAAWDFIVPLFKFAVDTLTLFWDTFGETIIDVISIAWNLIKDIFLGAFEIIEGIFQIFTGILTLDWDKAWEGILSILKGIWKIILAFLRTIWDLLVAGFKLSLSIISTAWDVFWTVLKGLAVRGWELFKKWFDIAWTKFKDFWSGAWEKLKEIVGAVLGGLGDVVKHPFNLVIIMIEGLINKAISGLNFLIGLANKIPGVSIPMLGVITLPRLRLGADVIKEGLALVGENGPEIVRLSKGAQVAPLGSSADASRGGFGLGPAIQIDQVVFQGTPEQMLEDWKRHTKLALRGI